MIDLSKCTMVEVGHYDGGKTWFGYKLRCVEHPRLTRMDKYFRVNRSVTFTFSIDGKEVASLEEAAKLLAIPYLPTPEDIDLLRLVPEQFTRLENRSRFTHLQDVGLVEFWEGECRLTETGKAALNG